MRESFLYFIRFYAFESLCFCAPCKPEMAFHNMRRLLHVYIPPHTIVFFGQAGIFSPNSRAILYL